jgi:hypothetical protein
MSLAAMLAVM